MKEILMVIPLLYVKNPLSEHQSQGQLSFFLGKRSKRVGGINAKDLEFVRKESQLFKSKCLNQLHSFTYCATPAHQFAFGFR
jgi:hypothetical protein